MIAQESGEPPAHHQTLISGEHQSPIPGGLVLDSNALVFNTRLMVRPTYSSSRNLKLRHALFAWTDEGGIASDAIVRYVCPSDTPTRYNTPPSEPSEGVVGTQTDIVAPLGTVTWYVNRVAPIVLIQLILPRSDAADTISNAAGAGCLRAFASSAVKSSVGCSAVQELTASAATAIRVALFKLAIIRAPSLNCIVFAAPGAGTCNGRRIVSRQRKRGLPISSGRRTVTS